MKLQKFLPILEWLPKYKKEYLKGDTSAGLTVGIMLIPQGMAYASIAGLPPVYGLYAALVPQIIYAILGTSRQLAVGPVAMDSLLVAAGVSVITEAGTEEYITLALLLALMMGVMQFLFGILRLGFLVNFLSKPVISGFTSAAALIIGLNQLKYLLGTELPRSNQIHELIYHAALNIPAIHWLTFLLGLGGILLILGIKKLHKDIPAALVLVVVSIFFVWSFSLESQGVSIMKNVPSGIPTPKIPHLNFQEIEQLLPTALTLALIAFMEAISISKAVQARHKDYELDANQELIALGAANMIGSIFNAYPGSGGFSRTAVNDQAGAKTGISAIVSAMLVALILLFFTPLFYYLPKAVLASIIIVAVSNLIDFKYPAALWKTKKEEFLMLIVTFIITLTVGIREGILTGIILSLLVVIYRTTNPHYAILGAFPNSREYRNILRFPSVTIREDILILRYDADMYFANIAHFKDVLRKEITKKGDKLKLVIINAESVNALDSSAQEILVELNQDLRKNGVQFYFTGLKGPIRDYFKKGNLFETFGENTFFLDIQEAIDFYDQKGTNWAELSSEYAKQSN